VILCTFLLGFSFHALGQEATIVGTVTDPSGSVVTKAAITVINTDTGQTRNTVTNDTGQYVAPDLVIGHYTLRVQAPGFKSLERKDIVLAVGDRTRMDFKLELGSAQQTVTVEATTVAVQTESGEVSTAITGQQVIPAGTFVPVHGRHGSCPEGVRQSSRASRKRRRRRRGQNVRGSAFTTSLGAARVTS
jgi:Carboxypeptidase regulatory-like domain